MTGNNGYKSMYMNEWVTSLLAAVLKVVSHALSSLIMDTFNPPDCIHTTCKYDGIPIEITIKFGVSDGIDK